MAKKPIPLPIEAVEPPKDDECPKCPPPGAPAWMATFADIAILLMAFFVLILSFAEFNQPKFKMISGSLKHAFGVQREIPVVEQPRGTTILQLTFSPSPEPSVTRTLRQDTTQIEQKKIKSDVDEKQKRDEQKQEKANDPGKSPEVTPEDAQKQQEEQKRQLAELLQQALQQGQLTAQMKDGKIVLDYDPDAEPKDPADQPAMSDQTETRQNEAVDGDDPQYPSLLTDEEKQALRQDGDALDSQDRTGLPQILKDMASGETLSLDNVTPVDATEQTTQQTEQQLMAELIQQLNNLAEDTILSEAQSQAEAAAAEGDAGIESASIAADKLAVALRQELGEGLVSVERREDKVFVTVGAGGAFPSGTADLTYDARAIMDRIAFTAMNDASQITVTGHTDDVPLSAGSEFRDNWGLAAGRASSVVRELAASGLIDPSRLSAASMGETAPVADNSTAEGRAENRRIEIEISY